ncbi:MAG: 2,3,4,5-tetrahydropyridine-2,6-dicarboxylate N-succinyltransferase [Candidatus Eisenbacteria bacterium]|uniref:2,3,4,5-tetrahydropyridine-2,6-dicarboxylate N-succinyltransferase n=1 Tax=Eiseniibacteriota bacterium TaxID=2212470 RepID=A0A938BNA7_UNCEI|nr:2,3,4,5-tetrahydropyridine-2,6-dicarboxylate N-succinyltransferase [Candidatus Eisenbacteria bacterium]
MPGLIEAAWADAALAGSSASRAAVERAVALLDAGEARVAEKVSGAWVVHGWLQMAILLYFRQREATPEAAGPLRFRDKIPVKGDLAERGVRVVPPGTARYGSFLEPGVVLMPGYVNIGARVGAGTMVDTWATVGSGAQIGRGCHLSGGVGIGGVLEPPQSRPVIVEDGAFIGSRSILVEGVIVGERAALGAGCVLTAATPIVDVRGPAPRIGRGAIPPGVVAIPGTWPRRFPAGEFQLPCVLIVGERRASTDEKTRINEHLREFPWHEGEL